MGDLHLPSSAVCVQASSHPTFSPVSEIAIQIKKEETSISKTSTLIGYGGRTLGREELALVPTPLATETHRPIPHHEIVRALVETLGFRHIRVVHDEYAVSPDGMRMFGVLDLASEMEGCRLNADSPIMPTPGEPPLTFPRCQQIPL
jgi:hypothetical protein